MDLYFGILTQSSICFVMYLLVLRNCVYLVAIRRNILHYKIHIKILKYKNQKHVGAGQEIDFVRNLLTRCGALFESIKN